MTRGILITAAYLLLLGSVPLLSAGRLDWPMAWAATGIYAAISITSLVLADRDLVRERSRMCSEGNRRDVLLATVSFLFFYPLTLAIAGLDFGRCGWSRPFHPLVHIVDLGSFTLGNLLGLWAVLTNRYISTFMCIQEDRAHRVVTSGPYNFIRHPGYAGTILAALALPLALGSAWALIPAAVGDRGFIVRTAVEDRMLLRDLPGYVDYARRVPFRLIPGIW